MIYLTSKFLIGDSSYFELLVLNKKIRQDLKVVLHGTFLISHPHIPNDLRNHIHKIMVPD